MQTGGFVYTCPPSQSIMNNPISTGTIRVIDKPLQPGVMIFFDNWVYDNGLRKYASVSINSLFGYQFTDYKKVKRLELQFCLNVEGHDLYKRQFVTEDNFRYANNYRLLVKNISPFVYYGAIFVDRNKPAHLICSFVLH